MSFLNNAIRRLLWLRRHPYRSADRTRRQVKGRLVPKAAPIPPKLAALCKVDRWQAHGQDVITLTPRDGMPETDILFFHGGAYINPIGALHWDMVRELVLRTGARITVPLYALAPEQDHRPGTALADTVFDRLARQGTRLYLAGDSAGANFALTQSICRRDADLSLPDGLILFSPWLDLTLADPAARRLERLDPLLGVDGLRLCGQWWAGNLDPAAPRFSPLHADLAGLPPMALFQGDRDIFLPDCRSFVKRARVQGVEIAYAECPGGFHDFMALTFTPEAKAVFRDVAQFVAR